MIKTLYKLIHFIRITLTACFGNGKCNNINGGLSLTMDEVSTVPLINNQSQSFYVYATNNGTLNMSNIAWTINNQASVVYKNIIQNNESQAILIKDTSECTSLAVDQSCRIQLLSSVSITRNLK